MAGMGSVICFGGRAERRARCAEVGAGWVSVDDGGEVGDADEGKTMPGESRSLSLLSILTSRSEVVIPASAPVGQAEREDEEEPLRREVRALVTEDLPTLG